MHFPHDVCFAYHTSFDNDFTRRLLLSVHPSRHINPIPQRTLRRYPYFWCRKSLRALALAVERNCSARGTARLALQGLHQLRGAGCGVAFACRGFPVRAVADCGRQDDHGAPAAGIDGHFGNCLAFFVVTIASAVPQILSALLPKMDML
jgi:hypothetical protein